MAPTPVVTCFLRHRDDVLLLRRSDAVGSYRGRWAGVSGHVHERDGTERDPLDAARAEVDEETGLLDACTLVRAGDPFRIHDPDSDRTWEIHPFLFDCDSRAVSTNRETTAYEWAPPTAILDREPVPALWTSYDHVRPTVDSVAEDDTHGAAYLSIRALDVLRDRAGELAASGGATDDWDALAALARELLDARPSMAALRNRVNRAMAAAADRTPQAVHASAQATIQDALDADDAAAATAADVLAGAHVLTLSRSGTVYTALTRTPPDRVTILESRPGGEGVGVAESLAAAGLDVTLAPDAAVAHVLATADVEAVVVGADTVLADGRVVNKVGTHTAAVAANRAGVPLFVVTATDKVSTGTDVHLEAADAGTVYDGDSNLHVDAPLFDATPADLVSGYLTEDGTLDADGVAAVAARHAEHEAWQER